MDISGTYLVSVVGLIVALSVAAERLVEIVKGVLPFLNQEHPDDKTKEGWRRATLHALGVVAGIATAFLARPAIPEAIVPATNTMAILALGLLASGGSGFWNSVLTYMLKVKDLKEVEVRAKENVLIPEAIETKLSEVIKKTVQEPGFEKKMLEAVEQKMLEAMAGHK